MTLALPKHGLLTAPETGELYLADISVPSRLYAELGLTSGGRILGGQLDANTGARVAANYLIPYAVSSLGLLAGTRVRQRFREGHHEQPHRDRTDMTATTRRRTQP